MISWMMSTTLLLGGAALLHPNHVEHDLLYHFAAGTHPIQNGAWMDTSHQVMAQVAGSPQLAQRGPSEGLHFAGQEYLSLAQDGEEARLHLPQREFSIATWVSLDAGGDGGPIVSYRGQQGDAPRGWSLGSTSKGFTFDLATAGGAANGEPMTTLSSRVKVDRRRWYYVVATYDGQTMRLYVNGELQNQSVVQSGDILYPREAPYVVGGGTAGDAAERLKGLLFELKAYARTLDEGEIRGAADKNANLVAWNPPPEKDLTFLVQPYLQFGTQDSMTVMCETSRPTQMRVDYAEVQPLKDSKQTEKPELISELVLTGLKPMTRYFYRVTCTDDDGQELASDVFSFRTAPTEDMPWAFTVIGDTQRNPEVTRRCAEGAYSRRPDFLLHCGDVVNDGYAKNQWLKDLFEPCSKLMCRVPTFPVIGNHEKNSHWYYDYFSLPKPEYYYTFRYGNSQFFMLDSNKSLAPGSAQYQWLESELASSKATWKFTCHHHPCFSSEENDYGDHEQGAKDKVFTYGDRNAQQLIPLYEKNGVDIAFNGHIHYYERHLADLRDGGQPEAGRPLHHQRWRRRRAGIRRAAAHLVLAALPACLPLLLRRDPRSHDRVQGLRHRRQAVRHLRADKGRGSLSRRDSPTSWQARGAVSGAMFTLA